jgi:hypothetical protein
MDIPKIEPTKLPSAQLEWSGLDNVGNCEIELGALPAEKNKIRSIFRFAVSESRSWLW